MFGEGVIIAPAPQPGESFVWLEAEPGQWAAETERIDQVVARVREGWLVTFVAPAVEEDQLAPFQNLFTPRMLARMRRPRIQACVIARGQDGQWHAVRPEADAFLMVEEP